MPVFQNRIGHARPGEPGMSSRAQQLAVLVSKPGVGQCIELEVLRFPKLTRRLQIFLSGVDVADRCLLDDP
eukprot:6362575-Karenia_brevis.AAC.1